ncbi:hypothetical protein VL20_1832 [Microcystis panniformis FACHB-1757]|uniref:Uncharacterized protein n=1 Tax=Microcystis panniformis FACHB-1757 TaxID=1638788 RepID=A0A0K1RYJ4_9CHRO|nr:hypothetical protein VL20_1832 [Microcystis panniformis FACHB-1757]
MLIWTESCRIFTNKNNCLINVGDLLFMIAILINIGSSGIVMQIINLK